MKRRRPPTPPPLARLDSATSLSSLPSLLDPENPPLDDIPGPAWSAVRPISERAQSSQSTESMSTMRTIHGWDLKAFLTIDPEQRKATLKALNNDTRKLISEMDPSDPLCLRLKEELRLTNEHFYNLLQQARPGPNPISFCIDCDTNEFLAYLEDDFGVGGQLLNNE